MFEMQAESTWPYGTEKPFRYAASLNFQCCGECWLSKQSVFVDFAFWRPLR